MYQNQKKCGDCLLCIHSYKGCECSLTDNIVDYNQDACIDFLSDED